MRVLSSAVLATARDTEAALNEGNFTAKGVGLKNSRLSAAALPLVRSFAYTRRCALL